MTQAPLVSVVMTAYNAQETIERAVQSVLQQSEPRLELVVVDDGSADETGEILARLAASDDRLNVLAPRPNAGVSAARNRALEACRGTWITFLDSDDEFTPTRIADTLAATNDTIDIVVCAHTLVTADGKETIRRNRVDGVADGPTALATWLADGITPFMWDTMVRATIAKSITFATTFHRGEDLVYGVSAAARARHVCVLAAPLARYYIQSGGLTWGRVPPLEETQHSVDGLTGACREHLGDRRVERSLRTARCLMWLNTASQAARSAKPEEADAYVRECGSRIPWSDITGGVEPRYALAAALIKTAPSLYRRLYHAYISRVYGLRRAAS